MIKTEQEHTKYLESINFCIKDYYSTSLKYSEYKNIEFKQFLKDNEEKIKGFLIDFNQEIYNLFIHNYEVFEMSVKDRDFKNKKDIRGLKNYVNYKTQDLIIKFLEDNFNNLNDNTKRNFCIKFYLNFYDLINEEMKKALIEIVENQTEDF